MSVKEELSWSLPGIPAFWNLPGVPPAPGDGEGGGGGGAAAPSACQQNLPRAIPVLGKWKFAV